MPQCASACFDPLELLPLIFLALWGLLAELGDSFRAILPKEMCCHIFSWDLLVDPLCLVQMMHFWTLWLFQALCLRLNRLIGPTLVHGSGHGKGRSKLSWLGFRCGWVISQHGQVISWCGQVISWHGWDLSWYRWVHKLSSPVSRSLCQARLGRAI